ncbi:MAG: hypothetical protein CBE00_13795 [Planctomycetaceae bacterium TMED240]|nr:hypothetical protein [Rhodopirellula sp.]OUX03816.1 MAG: hypothetical protein CBE00_13795 [Planctomycetaceae bacterium TMED240]
MCRLAVASRDCGIVSAGPGDPEFLMGGELNQDTLAECVSRSFNDLKRREAGLETSLLSGASLSNEQPPALIVRQACLKHHVDCCLGKEGRCRPGSL